MIKSGGVEYQPCFVHSQISRLGTRVYNDAPHPSTLPPTPPPVQLAASAISALSVSIVATPRGTHSDKRGTKSLPGGDHKITGESITVRVRFSIYCLDLFTLLLLSLLFIYIYIYIFFLIITHTHTHTHTHTQNTTTHIHTHPLILSSSQQYY